MSWYSRTWVSCAVWSCDQEILRNRAEQSGWLLREGQRALCPLHRPRVPPADDVARRAAGDRDEE